MYFLVWRLRIKSEERMKNVWSLHMDTRRVKRTAKLTQRADPRTCRWILLPAYRGDRLNRLNKEENEEGTCGGLRKWNKRAREKIGRSWGRGWKSAWDAERHSSILKYIYMTIHIYTWFRTVGGEFRSSESSSSIVRNAASNRLFLIQIFAPSIPWESRNEKG